MTDHRPPIVLEEVTDPAELAQARVLGFEIGTARARVGGIGGVAESVDVTTRIRLPRDGSENN